MEIAGQAALVSGGASGLGRATAAALAGAGARVALLDLNGAAADAVAKELGATARPCRLSNSNR
jgi:NAD(P)-dependent dehydrogenase (short-subunit alcohol dehydrogenase family)